MIKLWCMGLIISVMIAEGTHYNQGDLILQVRQQSVRRRCSQYSYGVDCCRGKTKAACRNLGGYCISKSKTKSCNGTTISGCKYCGKRCQCCVPLAEEPTTEIAAPNNVVPTTEVPITEVPITEVPITEEVPTTENALENSTPVVHITKAPNNVVPTTHVPTTKEVPTTGKSLENSTPVVHITEAPNNVVPTTHVPTTKEVPTTENALENSNPVVPTTEAPSNLVAMTEVPTTEAARTAPTKRPPRRESCTGSWNGLEYTGLCKLDCAATGMVETYDHDCGNTRMRANTYKCCIEEPQKHCNISGTPYKSGKRFSQNCMMFECDDGKLKSELKYNKKCGECSARNDPHWNNFDVVKFDWHGQIDGVMVQQGREECPSHYVGMGFQGCLPEHPKFATCWANVYYQTPSGVQINVPYSSFESGHNPSLTVDGNEQTLNDEEISILQGASGEVPVIGFKKNDCLHILGIEDEGFLVAVCAWQVRVYAYPSLKTNIAGLCGSWSGLTNEYEMRDGSLVAKPTEGKAAKRLPSVVGDDWEMPSCLFKGRRRRTVSAPRISDDEELCNATVSQLEGFKTTCSASIESMGPALDNDTKTEMKNDCEFDLCIAIARANDQELADQFLSQTEKVAVQVESAANDTVQYPPGQPGAPNATDHGPNFVVFEWAEPEGASDANILTYVIQRRDLSGGNWTQCGEVNGNLTTATITDVEQGHDYIFQVIAVSEAGESEPSESSKSLYFELLTTIGASTFDSDTSIGDESTEDETLTTSTVPVTSTEVISSSAAPTEPVTSTNDYTSSSSEPLTSTEIYPTTEE